VVLLAQGFGGDPLLCGLASFFKSQLGRRVNDATLTETNLAEQQGYDRAGPPRISFGFVVPKETDG